MDVEKAALRGRLRVRRRALARAHPFAGEALVETFSDAGLAAPASAAVYSRSGSEIDPEPLARWLALQGVEIALPVVIEAGQPLAFQRRGERLSSDALGLPCPMPHQPLVAPQIIFAPLLGFDCKGHRLGQGGGFYDRTIAVQRRREPPPLVIGLAYAGQAVEHIPTDAFDQRLDGVLTESAYLDFRGAPEPMRRIP